MGFTLKEGSEKGSQKGFLEGSSPKVPRTSPGRVRPLGVRPLEEHSGHFLETPELKRPQRHPPRGTLLGPWDTPFSVD